MTGQTTGHICVKSDEANELGRLDSNQNFHIQSVTGCRLPYAPLRAASLSRRHPEVAQDRFARRLDDAFQQPVHLPTTGHVDEAALLEQFPPADPDAPITVVTSLRLPYELKRRVEAAAAAADPAGGPRISFTNTTEVEIRLP